MASAKINVHTDAEIKKQAEELLNAMGLTMTAAINIYLKRIVLEGGIPFEVTARVPNAVTIQAMEEGRRIAKDDNVPSFNSVADLRADMGL